MEANARRQSSGEKISAIPSPIRFHSERDFHFS
jgi:hypothetical protein